MQTSIAGAPCGSAGKFWWPTSDSDAKDMYVHDPAAPTCSSGGNLASYMLIQD